MTAPAAERPRLRVMTYNLLNGGIDDGSRDRLWGQVEMLAPYGPDVLALQEGKGWDDELVAEVGAKLGMTGYSVPSNHRPSVGESLQLLYVREPYVQVVKALHDTAPPWWCAVAALVVRVEDVDLAVGCVHLAPSSPAIRLAEAEALQLFAQRGVPAVLMGDFNALPAKDPLPIKPRGYTRTEHYQRKINRGAARALAGDFLDVGAEAHDLTPTVGHFGSDRLAYRCDRIHTTLPREAIEDYVVVEEDEPASDHRPVLAVFRL